MAPSDAVHCFLLFWGQDIKDFHIHEGKEATETKTDSSNNPSNTEVALTGTMQQAVAKKEDTSSRDSDQSVLMKHVSSKSGVESSNTRVDHLYCLR